ncbi:MAG: cytochrome P450 [Acidimicrobiales bacterium]|nr:cytochrome P450 [Acidimicrobiales bacterium]
MTDADSTPWLDGLPEGADPEQYEAGECPWEKFARATHDTWGHRLNDVLVVSEHATMKGILSDRRFQQGMHARIRRQAPDLDPRFVERRRDALLGREGPDHIRMRRIASKSAFTPKAANRHRPLMQQVMNDLADRIPDDGIYDAVQLVHDYPSTVIAQVLGSRPDEVTAFSSTVGTIFDAQRGIPEAVPKAWDAIVQLDAHILDLVERKREQPGEDLITDLLRAESEDGVLSTQEVHDIAVAVVMAGTETTRNALTRGLQLLAERPDIWQQLVDDDHLSAAVEEILRFAPLAPLRRVPSEDLPVHDLLVPEGEVIVLDLGAANRDPEAFDDPDTFRIDRAGSSKHFTLGHGHKYCLGANLAKAEMVEALRVLVGRFPRLEVAEPPVWSSKGQPRGQRVVLRFSSMQG